VRGVVKRPRQEVDHSPSSNAEVKNVWCFTALPPMRLPGVKRETFIFVVYIVGCLFAHSRKHNTESLLL
jgi:hypothetical protein